MFGDPTKQELFRELVDRFAHFIHHHIQRYNLARFGLDAEDIAQDVRLKIWKIIQDEKPIYNYASYIKKIVDSSVIDQLRKCRREEGYLMKEKQNLVSEIQISYWSHLPEGRHLQLLMEKAIDKLLESRKKAVRLFLLNMSIDEIATFYGWSRDKARNLLYRGLSDLRKALTAKDVLHED